LESARLAELAIVSQDVRDLGAKPEQIVQPGCRTWSGNAAANSAAPIPVPAITGCAHVRIVA